MSTISVILPVLSTHSKDFTELFEKSIDSVKQQQSPIDELIIVHTDEESLVTFLNNYDFGDLKVEKVLNNTNSTDFQSQVNLGISKANSEWISILEFDDEYSFIWFKNVRKYIQAHPECDGFLPLVVDVDNKGMFAGYTNEATFAASFNTEIGILTNELLNEYQNFQTSGMVIKKSFFEDFGGFKQSMRLTFVYELLLRLTYNSARIMTIPRIGYKHTNMRESSIFWNYKFGDKKITETEAKFWIDTAKKEYFFTYDRNIKYEETNV